MNFDFVSWTELKRRQLSALGRIIWSSKTGAKQLSKFDLISSFDINENHSAYSNKPWLPTKIDFGKISKMRHQNRFGKS